MITLAYARASDSAGPDTRGFRAGYGFFGRLASDYPWGEYWVAYRRHGNFEITAAGLSVAPGSLASRRLGLGLLFDLGVSRRRSGDRIVLAAMGGIGGEGVFRIGRSWDAVVAAEAVYRTTGDSEVQARIGVRFHHDRLPAPAGAR